ncbi:MAG: PEP-CTERM sorting domain-containing protein [Fimbriimonadales bacterium]|nr:PEP-CTERM sorting domain-containing protein [Fimbriimonadales bacterium]
MHQSNHRGFQGRFRVGALLFALSALLCSALAQRNRIFNHDFELGNVGFQSDYVYNPNADGSDPQRSLAPGQYIVTTDPSLHHHEAISYDDLSRGDGMMLMLKGATIPNQAVWRQTVPVEPGPVYAFKGWVSIWTAQSPPLLQLRVNDEPIGVFNFPEPPRPGLWYQWHFEWDSSATTGFQATLSIVNLNTSAVGNGFALDALEFYLIPEPTAILGLVVGLGGLAWRRRFSSRE